MSTFKGFDTVQLRSPKKSSFDLTHDRRMSMSAGNLTPILCMECIPSDRFRGSSEILMRLAPLLAPIYDQINLYVHYFFVPNRLLWDEWETFITGGRLGPGSTDPVTAPIPPRINIGAYEGINPGQFVPGTLADYMGLPDFFAIDPDVLDWEEKYFDAMPFAAYYMIFEEYYKDRNFTPDYDNGVEFPMPSGDVDPPASITALLTMRTRAWRPDYFTSALPFTQRGDEVLMPVQLGGLAPLYVDPPSAGASSTTVSGIKQPGAVAVGMTARVDQTTVRPFPEDLWIDGADFDGTTTSINDFRSAYALQVWLERNAIGGSRYTESTQAHFDVKPQDSRLQRPEYIGGGRISVKISEVLSTAWSQDGAANDVPLANMAGHGITYGNTNQFNYYCTEHGFILGIASILSPASYQQGMSRMFRRGSFLDYVWPTFAKLGEQPVYDYELYTTPASLTADTDSEYPVFGYQSRYADWKWLPSTNHGDFKTSLLFWTLTRTFSSAPVLNQSFTRYDKTIMDRIFAVEPDAVGGSFWLYVHNKVNVIRPLPYFGVPNTLGFGS